jgi:flagellar hook-basal body complex protein FliE
MTLPAITPISAISASAAPSPATGATSTSPSSGGSDFAGVLSKGIDALQGAQDKSDSLAVQAATGDLNDISQYTIAASQASLATQLASTLRTKAVDAFNQIMGMQA